MGGKGPFFAQYGVQAAAALIANRSFNVHDKIGLEKEAEDKANELHQQFKWLLRSRVISLKCNNGQYVCAEGSGASTVVANRNAIGDWERFWLVPVDGGKVALAVNNGQFVCAEGGGGREVVANRNRIGPWEKFKLVAFGGNKVAIRAHNGQYVCAEGVAVVSWWRTVIRSLHGKHSNASTFEWLVPTRRAPDTGASFKIAATVRKWRSGKPVIGKGSRLQM